MVSSFGITELAQTFEQDYGVRTLMAESVQCHGEAGFLEMEGRRLRAGILLKAFSSPQHASLKQAVHQHSSRHHERHLGNAAGSQTAVP